MIDLVRIKSDLATLTSNYGDEAVQDFLKDSLSNSNYATSYFGGRAEEYKAAYSLLQHIPVEVKEPMDDKVLKEKVNNIKVGITNPFSIGSLKKNFPSIELIKSVGDVMKYDLIVVPGGEDVNPKYYGSPNRGSYFDNKRDEVEVPLVEAALHSNRKLFGICRGHQLINILLGCNFVQDIMSEEFAPHPSYHDLEWTNVGSSSVLFRFFNNRSVVSMHHQGLSKVNNRKVYTACMYKGIVEGCEGNNIITTQFHPEFQEDNEAFFSYLKEWAFIE
jgi:putative glutamine amidotransferase